MSKKRIIKVEFGGGRISDNMENTAKPRIKASLGQPPRFFKKKKSIAVFSCTSHKGDCPEIMRARISNAGDIYLFPLVAYGSDFHLSYHQSGRFHWTFDDGHEVPLYGEDDFNAAYRMMLQVSQHPCYCLRLGKSLSVDEMEKILEILVTFLPFNFSIDDVVVKLDSDRFVVFSNGVISPRKGVLGTLTDTIFQIVKCGS